MKYESPSAIATQFETKLRNDELSPNTVRNYSKAVRTYLKYCRGNVCIDTAIAFKQHLKDLHVESTVNLYINALNCFLKFSGETYELKCVPIKRVTTTENVITEEEYSELCEKLSESENFLDTAIVYLLSQTGMRISEMLTVTFADIVRGYKNIPTKNKTRTVIFPDSLKVIILKDGKNPAERVVPITVRAVQKRLYNMADKFGIRKSVMHPHSFRHFFAIRFLKHDKDLSLLSNLLGHSSISTTAIYLTLSREEQTERLNNVMKQILEDIDNEM